MRFDILDEYSTLVPSGIGVFQKSRVANSLVGVADNVKSTVKVKRDSRLKYLFVSIKMRRLLKFSESA